MRGWRTSEGDAWNWSGCAAWLRERLRGCLELVRMCWMAARTPEGDAWNWSGCAVWLRERLSGIHKLVRMCCVAARTPEGDACPVLDVPVPEYKNP